MSFVGNLVKNVVGGIGHVLGLDIGGGGSKVPIPPPMPAPTVANNSSELDAQALAAQRAMMGGRTSTMLTGGMGFEEDPKNTSKILLGQ